MNRFDKFALAAAAIVTLVFFGTACNAFEIYVVMFHMPQGMIPVAVLGWLLFTYGPIVLAALLWRWSKHMRRPWVLHLIALPLLYGVGMLSVEMMLYAANQPDFDDTLGAPVFAGSILFLLAVAGYLAAMISTWLARHADRAEAV